MLYCLHAIVRIDNQLLKVDYLILAIQCWLLKVNHQQALNTYQDSPLSNNLNTNDNNNDFSSLALHPDLISNLASLGYKEMTPIQRQSLPLLLDKKDVIAQAKTGSGKTAAFGLSVLHHLDVKKYRVQTLILCPTRELADQVAKEIRKLARGIHNIKVLTLCGGMPFGPQIGSLEHGAHIVVGTPGRLEEHLRKNKLNLDHLSSLVFDEADRMLDMGFKPAIDAILEHVPAQHQTLLFSATFPAEISAIAKRIMTDPVTVKVESTHDNTSIEQIVYKLDNKTSRISALQTILLSQRPDSAVIFCNTKIETQEVASQLNNIGLSAVALNGDLEQRQREQILVRFSNKSASILVATDVAARGLDIDDLGTVINYQIARELEVHTHRIGRTGRAGSQGTAYTLISDKESYKLRLLEEYIGQTLATKALPSSAALKEPSYKPPMATLQIDGGKKQKIRAGDILGALTGKDGIDGKYVGKINIFDNCAYVAISSKMATDALHKIEQGKLKGRSFRVRLIRG
jgi:ATP-independent RNA helicase DbpA